MYQSDIIEQIKHLRNTKFPEVELILFGSSLSRTYKEKA